MSLARLLCEYDEGIAVLLTGGVAVCCLLVVPIWGFGGGFLSPGGRTIVELRGRSALFMLTYLTGTASATLCLVLAVGVVLPAEWVDAD